VSSAAWWTHTRNRPGRAGLTVAYKPVRESRGRSTSSRLMRPPWSCSSVRPGGCSPVQAEDKPDPVSRSKGTAAGWKDQG
jgi:hypothetical protein